MGASAIGTLYGTIVLISSGLLIVLAILLLTGHVPDGDEMDKYRRSRLFLFAAYLIMAASAIFKSFSHGTLELQTAKMISLTVGSFQALLFTIALITLILPAYITRKNVLIHFSAPLSIVALLIFTHAFYIALTIYIAQLIYYTFLFEKNYSISVKLQKYFYSGNNDIRMHWVRRYFYAALSFGILILISVFVSMTWYVICMMICVAFYSMFAIKYRDYVSLFQKVVVSTSNDSRDKFLGDAINKWIAEKQYVSNSVSLDDIARSIGTNRTYLSQYINRTQGKSFKMFRTELRVEEAKKLLLKNPNMPTSEIGLMSGFEDPSNFNHCFKSITGLTPLQWKQQKM